MSVDKLVDSTQLDADLTSIANAIRTKGGTSAQLAFPADFISAINAISGGGSSVETGTFTPAENVSNYTISALAGTTKDHILIKATPNTAAGLISGTRTWGCGYFYFGSQGTNWVSIGSNSGGTGMSAAVSGQSHSSSNVIYFDRTTGKITVKTGTSGGGYIGGGKTFEWFAW